MITTEDLTADVLTRSYVLHTRVAALLGDEVLAEDVPVAAGALEFDRTVAVSERASLTVPRLVDGVSWDPSSDTNHPLAPYGQTLRIELGVELFGGEIDWIQRAEVLVREASVEGDAVNVECVGLLALIDEARFTTPYQASGTFQSTIRSLCGAALPVRFAAGLPTNRSIPTASLTADEDRLATLHEVLDAWPADAYVDANGVLQVVPATDSASPVLTLTDGAGGTVLSWAGTASRDGAFNMVVARGQDSAGAQVQGEFRDIDAASPFRYGGPFNPLPVPFFYFSPLLTTTTECRTAAETILNRHRRTAARRVSAQCVPHPALETGDRVTIEGVDGATAGIVETLTLPLTAAGGAMTLGLRVVA